MHSLYRAGALLAITALALSGCSNDEPSKASDPAASTPTSSAPGGPALTCPPMLSYANFTGTEAPATAVDSVEVPTEAILCSYQQTGSDDSSGWTSGAEPVTLDEAQRTSLFGVLSWRPQPADQPCTMDLGPVHAVSWRAADGATAALAVEDFGCRNAYVLKDLDTVAAAGAVALDKKALTALKALAPLSR